MEMPSVAIEYELTPEDWEAANAAHLFSSPLQIQMIRRAQMSGAGIFALIAMLMLVSGGGIIAAIMALLAGGVFAASVAPLQQAAQRRTLKKLGQEGVANGTFGPHRVEVRDDGLLNATTQYEWLIRWTAIENVREEDGMFLIYTGTHSFLPIPATAFRDATALRDFADAFYHRVALHRVAADVVTDGTAPDEGGERALGDGTDPRPAG